MTNPTPLRARALAPALAVAHRVALADALMVALAIALAGCASTATSSLPNRSTNDVTTPTTAPPSDALPERWQVAPAARDEGASPPALAAWWLDLHDPALDRLMADAQARNRDVARSALRVAQFDVQAQRSRADQWPTLGASLGATVGRPLDGAGVRTQGSYGASVSASYEIDLWQRVRRGVTLAEQQAEAGRADLDAARWLLGTQVAEQYWTIAALDARAALLRETLAHAEAGLAATRQRFAQGLLRAGDVDAAVTALEAQRVAQRRLATDRLEATQRLAMLLDRAPQDLEPPAARLPEIDPPDLAIGPPARVLDRRPDVRGARLALQAALLRQQIQLTSFYPQFTLSASLGTGGAAWRDWLAHPAASLGVDVLLPLLDWQRLQADRTLAGLQVQDAALGFRDTLHKALVEVDQQFAERRQIGADLTLARQRLADAGRALGVAQARHAEGLVARQAVRDAAQARRDAEAAVIELRLRAWLNAVAIHKALGGPVGG